MISDPHALDRKIKNSNLEEIYKRLCIPKTDQSFAEILAEFGKEIANNEIFEPYVRNIGDQENEYRQNPDTAAILQKATCTPAGQQALDQKMLTRKERISEYFSLWGVLRFYELYDISLHERVRTELIAKNDLRDLADFEQGVILISNILEGNSNANLADYYLPHAHRVMSGIIQFFNKQQAVSSQAQNIDEKNLTHPQKSAGIKYKREITITVGNDEVAFSTTDRKLIFFKRYNKVNKEKNLRFYLVLLLCQNKQGIKKRELEKQLNATNIEINKAKTGIVDQVSNKWIDVKHILKLDPEKKKIIFNDEYQYNIVFLKD